MRTLLVSSFLITLLAVACGSAAPDESFGATSEALTAPGVAAVSDTSTADGIATSPLGTPAASDTPAADGIATSPLGATATDTPLVLERNPNGGSGGASQTYCKKCHKVCPPKLKECYEECVTMSCASM